MSITNQPLRERLFYNVLANLLYQLFYEVSRMNTHNCEFWYTTAAEKKMPPALWTQVDNFPKFGYQNILQQKTARTETG